MRKSSRVWVSQLILIGLIGVFTSGCNEDVVPEIERGTVNDVDGNTYGTVKIGSQTWMAENLRTTKYNDNTQIPNVTNDSAWGNITTPAYCWFDNDMSNKVPYGALYNWHSVNTGKLAPVGWHVATKDDWDQLFDYLGGSTVAGAKLKEVGISHWTSPNDDATNETGFTAIPGGYRYAADVIDSIHDGQFLNLGYRSTWWTATQDAEYPNTAWGIDLIWFANSIGSSNGPKGAGSAVRCVKD